jgi:hypothetical protein
MVVDQGSTNGTFINDERVGTSAIQSGDIIRFDAVAFRVQGHTRAATGAEVNQGGGSGGAGGSDRTMVLDTEDPRLSGLDLGRREPPPEEPEEEPIVLEHRFCVRHKSRISEQLCDGCTLPYCSDCLVDVMGEKLCSKCRTN